MIANTNAEIHASRQATEGSKELSLLSNNIRNANLSELAKNYQANLPFPHIVLSDFLDQAVAKKALSEFPGPSDIAWTQYRHMNSKKLGQPNIEAFPETIKKLVAELSSPRFLEWLSKLTGIKDLIADPLLEGGGLHQSVAGGFLNIHADFNRHYRHTNWARRLNLLVYFNENWKDDWNGHLELWDRSMTHCEHTIAPLFNRAVIFSTNEDSFHGHPEPLKCPEGVTRKSLALYYYTLDAGPAKKAKSTNYQFRPQDSKSRRAVLWADKKALAVYHFLRMKLKISDGVASKVIKLFDRRNR